MTTSSPSKYNFDLQASGRCGTISCAKDDFRLELDWEMSGVPDKDILLAPVDLSRWQSGEEITRVEQAAILEHLRQWLTSKRTRTDIARPTAITDPSKRCVRTGCQESPLTGFAYCPTHYDDTLLR